MVLICPKCETRLQLDEAKAPARPFTVRCPKCQTSVSAQPAAAAASESVTPEAVKSPDGALVFSRSPFEPPTTAPLFRTNNDESSSTAEAGATPGLNDLGKLLAEALRHSGSPKGT